MALFMDWDSLILYNRNERRLPTILPHGSLKLVALIYISLEFLKLFQERIPPLLTFHRIL